MKKALLLVDYIHDFVDDDGALTIGKPAQDIRENIIRAISQLGKNDLLVLANDCHNWQQPHPEKRLFPPHALAGTLGCQTVLPDEVKAAKAPSIVVNKRYYSAFAGTGLSDMLKAAGTVKLYIAGVATDICVLHSAIAAYSLGFDTVVLEDCVAAFDVQGHDFAMKHFKNVLGFEIATSREI